MAGRVPFELDYTPNASYWWLDAFTEAGVSFWPVVWLGGEDNNAKGPRMSERYASEIAHYLGGEASTCDADLSRCVSSVLDASSHGWTVRISGPRIDWPQRYKAKVLRLWYEPDPALLDVRRPFVRLEKPAGRPGGSIAYRTAIPAVPFFDAVWLTGKAGCDSGAGVPGRRFGLSALVPESVLPGIRSFAEILPLCRRPHPDALRFNRNKR